MSSDGGAGRGPTQIASVLIFAGLLLTLVVSIAPNVNTVVVEIAEVMWPGYASELRGDPEPPDCSVEELDEKLAACPPEDVAPAPAPGADEDPFGGANPFEDGGGGAEAEDEDPFGGANPFEDGGGGAEAEDED
ncbi:MAG: hypothetical protein D6798_17970, partial [Deltaproteobacteria bacterium]